MSTEQLFLIAFNVLLGLVAFFGGLWLRTITADVKELRDSLKDYALREDMRRELELTRDTLNRIDGKIDKFLDRLNTKADKP